MNNILMENLPQLDPKELEQAKRRAKRRLRESLFDNTEKEFKGIGVIAAVEELEALKYRCDALNEHDSYIMLHWIHRMLGGVLEKADDPKTTCVDELAEACENLSYVMALMEVMEEKEEKIPPCR